MSGCCATSKHALRLTTSGADATAHEADRARVFDDVINGVDLFDELWRHRTDDERASLRRMATAEGPIEPDAAALQLVREGYVEKRDGKVSIAVPLLRDWIRDNKAVG